MKLISCYVENFGGLHQYAMEFTEGLNCVRQPNGWGKTTFAVFIKAMLFGLEYSPRKKLEENERKKYTPWQGGAFGGNLVFETGGKRYRAERFFGAKDKEDAFCLYDADTGLESGDFTEKLGEELFHIDAASYGKSAYIPQNGTQAGVTDHLSARLGNIIENANDMERSTEAIAFLTERQKEYRRTGNRGKICETSGRISELEDRVAKCGQMDQALRNLEEQIARTKERRENLLKEKETLDGQISGEMKIREAQMAEEMKRREESARMEMELQEAKSALLMKRRELLAKRESRAQTERQIQQLKESQARLLRSREREKGELNARNARLQEEKERLEELQAGIRALNREKGGRIDSGKIRLLLVGLVVVIAAVILFPMLFSHPSEDPHYGVAICLVIVCVLLGFFIRMGTAQRKGTKRSREAVPAFEEQIEKLEEDCARLEDENRRGCQYMEELNRELHSSETEEKKLLEKLDGLKRELLTLKEDADNAAENLSEKQERVRERETAERPEKKAKGQPHDESRLGALQKQRRELEENVRALDRNIVEYRRDADVCMDALEERQDLETEMALLVEQKRQMEKNYHILRQTVKWLGKAKEQFASYYMEPLAKGFQKYVSLICGEEEDKARRTQMDISLDVRMEAYGALREKEYFSKGYRDLFGVCTRLALVDALFEGEKPFLILDDPFVNLDDEKMKRAGKLLDELSGTYQIIYLACHSGRTQEETAIHW